MRPCFALSYRLAVVALCLLAVTSTRVSAVDGPVTASARAFISTATAAPATTQRVAAEQQRSLVVSPEKAAALLHTATSVVLTDFPLTPYSNGVVELRRARPIIDGETVVRPNGRADASYRLPSMQIFRGTIRGEEHSRVIMTVINGNIYSSVEHSDGERYVITPAEATGTAKERPHVLFAERAVAFAPEEREFTCLQPADDDHTDHDGKHRAESRPLSNELLEFHLAIETDFRLLQQFKMDDVRMEEYILSLIAMVSSIYEDEVNVTFYISYYVPWTETDPYQANGNISTMLSRFAEYWRSRRGGVQRHIAHLITGPGSTGVGGIAYRDRLCNTFLGYSVSGIHGNYTYPTTSYTWDVNVIAHELGHNFRSHHTHDCSGWGGVALDSCVTIPGPITHDDACINVPSKPSTGSIMSYCHLHPSGKVELTFTTPVATVIRRGAEESCMQPPAQPVILIQNPLGNQVVAAGTPLNIRWASARVNMVGIEYSSDGGQSWNTITPAVAATQRSYNEWIIPAIQSSQMLVRVYDASNPAVNDVSTAYFEVRSPALTLLAPLGGERVAQNSELSVQWNRVLVSSVALDFSPDNGATWEPQATGLTGSEYRWTAPLVETSQARLRVRDESNNNLIAQSQPFTIGAPVIRVLAPVAGVEWLVGTEQQIRWEADFVDRVRITYRTNHGNWKPVGPIAMDAQPGTYTWTVPNDVSDTVEVRVARAFTSEGPEDTSAVFIITNVVSVEDRSRTESLPLSIVPQPARDRVEIGYTIDLPAAQVRVTLRDIAGRTVAEVWPEHTAAGYQVVELATASLAQGVYFVSVDINGTTTTRPLTIMR